MDNLVELLLYGSSLVVASSITIGGCTKKRATENKEGGPQEERGLANTPDSKKEKRKGASEDGPRASDEQPKAKKSDTAMSTTPVEREENHKDVESGSGRKGRGEGEARGGGGGGGGGRGSGRGEEGDGSGGRGGKGGGSRRGLGGDERKEPRSKEPDGENFHKEPKKSPRRKPSKSGREVTIRKSETPPADAATPSPKKKRSPKAKKETKKSSKSSKSPKSEKSPKAKAGKSGKSPKPDKAFGKKSKKDAKSPKSPKSKSDGAKSKSWKPPPENDRPKKPTDLKKEIDPARKSSRSLDLVDTPGSGFEK